MTVAGAGTPDQPAVDTRAIARLLNLTPQTVIAMVRRGDIPGFKAGRQWRFFVTKVIAHLEAPQDPWQQSRRSTMRARASDQP